MRLDRENASGGPVMYFGELYSGQATGGGFAFASYNQQFRIAYDVGYGGGFEKDYIISTNTAGNVGINSTPSTERLYVSGTMRVVNETTMANVLMTGATTATLLATTSISTGQLSGVGATIGLIRSTGITTATLLATTSISTGQLSGVGGTIGTLRATSITTPSLNTNMFNGVQYGKTGTTISSVNPTLSGAQVLSGYIHYTAFSGGNLTLPNGSDLYATTGITVGSMFPLVVRHNSGIGSGTLFINSGASGSTLVHNGNRSISEGGGQSRLLMFFVLSSTEYICYLYN
jgi:hypothetical protein